jgi:hypothetical protein
MRERRFEEVPEAGEQEVSKAVVVIIAPGNCALGDTWEAGTHFGEKVIASVAVEPGDGAANIANRLAREQNVQVAIVVKIDPGCGAVADAGKDNAGVGQGPFVIAIEAGERAVGRSAANEQIGRAIIIVIAPGPWRRCRRHWWRSEQS